MRTSCALLAEKYGLRWRYVSEAYFVKDRREKDNTNCHIILAAKTTKGMDKMEIQIEKTHKYLIAFNEILKERRAAGLRPVYDAGYLALDKQYLTIGVNGLVEGAEALNIPVETNNPEYIAYVDAVLSPIYAANRAARTRELMFNTEMVPAEGLGVKNAAWDKDSKLYVPRDCYNSYFFVVEDPNVNVLDKLRFHGKAFIRYLDGGSACHINLDEHLSKE